MARSITDFVIRIKVEGQALVDKLKTSTDGVDNSFKKAQTSSNKLNNNVRTLGSTLRQGITTGNAFADNILENVGNMGRFANVIVIAATAIIGLGTRAILLADQIQDLSDATGINNSQLLSLQQSLLNAGGEASDFATIVNRLSSNLGEAAQGNEKVRTSFRRLGIDLGDANGNLRSTSDLLPEILDALRNIPDPALRTATAVDLVGKSAAGIDWTKVESFNNQFTDEKVAQLARYKGAIDALVSSLQFKLIDIFGGAAIEINKFTDAVTASEEKANQLGKTYDFPNFFARIVAAAGVNGRQIGEIIEQTSAYFNVFSREMTDAEKKTYDFVKAVEFAKKAGLLKPPKQQTGELKISESEAAEIGNQLYKQEQDRLAATKKEVEERQKNFKIMNEQLTIDVNRGVQEQERIKQLKYQYDLTEDIALLQKTLGTETYLQQAAAQNELIGLYGREYEMKAELLAIDAERQNAINDAIANLRSISATANAESIAEDVERARREIELAHYVADERLKIFQDRKAKEKAIEQSTLGGIESAFAIIDAESNKFITAQKSVISVFDNMKNAITEFATTGKFKFKDFALSMIRDLLIIQAQQAFNTMFGMAKNPLLAFFGGGKAAGGPVKGNTAYVVGEKGPELFVPKGAGTIVPNNKMNSGSGQAAPANNTYNTYNISAIDSQSVAQFFAQNRKMALGAVTMAQKELSYGS
jgi:lambda family phage tail tape measure protein